MYNKLTPTDKDNILCWIEANISQNRQAPLEYILRHWSAAKENLCQNLFGGELILKRPILVEKSESAIQYEIQSILDDDKYRAFIKAYRNKLYDLYQDDIIDYYDCLRLGELSSAEQLAKRIWHNTNTIRIRQSNDPDGKDIVLTDGAKVTRLFMKVCRRIGLEAEAEEFVTAISTAFNDKKLKGNLCLSIHPLDFMTMSDNSLNWESCMSWQHSGCYRQGTVEMMNSPYVIVAYLESSSPFVLPNGNDWNNKKWRELYIIHPDIITNIKSYPYRNSNLTKSVISWIAELMDVHDWTPTEFIYSYDHDSFVYKDNKWAFEQLYFITNHMYCDMAVTGYLHYGYVRTLDVSDINYSGESECMCCGGVYDREEEGGLECCRCWEDEDDEYDEDYY